MRQKHLPELSPWATMDLPTCLPATPGWGLSRCSARPGASSLGPRGDHASCSPSQGALAPIQEASEVPGPILAPGAQDLIG